MFKAAYKDEFYLALRNALHAEVDSWHGNGYPRRLDLVSLWSRVFALEQTSRNSEATSFRQYEAYPQDIGTQLVHLQAVQPAR